VSYRLSLRWYRLNLRWYRLNLGFLDCPPYHQVQKSKENTARVVVWREFNLINSFTLEASFAGPSMGREVGFHYGVQRLEEMGWAFCDAMLHYCDPDTVNATHAICNRNSSSGRGGVRPSPWEAIGIAPSHRKRVYGV